MTQPFEIQDHDPAQFRRQTRTSTLICVSLFALLAMGLSTLAVQLFGSPEGSNFRWNLGGILLGLALSILVVRLLLWQQPWMAPAVYGWRLKRALMSINNVMHKVEQGVEAGDADSMLLLRFYHLGLKHMHELEGNQVAQDELQPERLQHEQRMESRQLPLLVTRLDPQWLSSVKQRY
ncbi:MAG: DUF3087 domain-containing protein [Gammaproteobacteria bacterium HGW-Gammaproteobacteria-6]|nr:MAG: DUF3087 domain-containing protein [Gammaproteobacteria bacterium HGW-Gammaproteobacteria-6]